jgi:UPF0755 protein
LIRNSEAFRLYLVYRGYDTRVQAGKYELSPASSSVEIAGRLQNSTPDRVVFAALIGFRAEEIAALLPSSGLSIEPEEFLQEVGSPVQTKIPAALSGLKSLEGYLFPGPYDLKRDTTLPELTSTFLRQFLEQVPVEMQAGFARQGLSLQQAVTLASIVQRESWEHEDQRKVASVFLNRLKKGMPLQSDPTVQYALGYNKTQQTWWTHTLGWADFEVKSPYNTYLYKGLPPGPICSPSQSALKAVANPAISNFLYFSARCDNFGTHNFSEDYTGHLKNICP